MVSPRSLTLGFMLLDIGLLWSDCECARALHLEIRKYLTYWFFFYFTEAHCCETLYILEKLQAVKGIFVYFRGIMDISGNLRTLKITELLRWLNL